MDKNSDEQLLVMQATIEANRQDYDEKMKKLTEELTAIIISMMDQIKISIMITRQEGFTKGAGSYHCGPS